VRAESYCDLSEEVTELRELRTQVVDELSKSREHGEVEAALSALQAVLTEHVAAAEEADDDDEADAGQDGRGSVLRCSATVSGGQRNSAR